MAPYFSFFDLCNYAVSAVETAVKDLLGTQKAYETLYTGADGTDTKLIDDVAERAIIEVLKKDGRSMRIISEEMGVKILGNNPEFTIIIDPIDGTYNASFCIPFYSVSIAIGSPDLSYIWAGYVKNISSKDIYYAESGKGAYLNGKRISPSKKSELNECCASVYGYRLHVERTVDLSRNIRRMRILGCVSLEICYVASGRFDAFVDVRGSLRLTDVAAGKFIVDESGGRVTDGFADSIELQDNSIYHVYMIASNGIVHDKLLKLTGGIN
ncbi:inositol monophosphatase [Methanohalobium evestigatum Z-7303]|uniref:fructose-bisphosphatase n=1 Tax=Methanohalobium evestigatum (strain ATCC BAA-1072 / DSM 3721 / NBRC 107634 / OCM 161 / Z-7303) TaxID=644295 RepID=D7E811_METEZ|nr:bifunctional fructose-bisphosphatase/inositol-phosphate phosphatase [Methanohalobium evestigatum]ADI73353.1 inositol monophosphatase [Methanohalobium evestigatum Z-7303]